MQQAPEIVRRQTAQVNDQWSCLSKRRLGVIGLFAVLMLLCGFEACEQSSAATYAATWWLVGMLLMAAAMLLAMALDKSLDRKER